MQRKTTYGFSIIEILIVITILTVLLSVVVSSFMDFRRSSILNTETQELVTLINRARILSISSKNDQQFGIHLEAAKVVLFQGTIYSPGAATNEEHMFNAMLTLSSIVVNGGGSELVFQKVTGATTQNATTTLLVVGTMASTTIVVRPTGISTIF